MDEQNSPPSRWKKIKRFFWITGTEKGEMQLKEFRQLLMVLITVVFFAAEIFLIWKLAHKYGWVDSTPSADYEKNIAVLMIDQEITDEYANTLIEKLDSVRENKDVFPHLLVILSTPGGSPSGSSEIAHYLKDLQKEMGVTMYVQGIAASGGYYIASAIEHNSSNPLSGIIAQENAIVGSIGVIMPKYVFKDLAKKVGVSEDDITVGKYKKPFSLFEYSTPKQKAYLKENLLNPAYKNFLQFVAKGRHVSIQKMEEYADGKIFIASEVVGPLVDRISYLSKVKSEIKERLEKKYTDQEVGFVVLNPKNSKSSFFSTEFNVENLHLGTNMEGVLKQSGNTIR